MWIRKISNHTWRTLTNRDGQCSLNNISELRCIVLTPCCPPWSVISITRRGNNITLWSSILYRLYKGQYVWLEVQHSTNMCYSYPSNTRRWPNVELMLAHRLRRWPNISPTLGQRLMFAGKKTRYNIPKFDNPMWSFFPHVGYTVTFGFMLSRLEPYFWKNRAVCDTSMKLGTELGWYIVVYFNTV